MYTTIKKIPPSDRVGKRSVFLSWNDISFDLYAVTQEEKDKITQTIDNIQGMVQWNMPGVEIIYEEAASYFAGDKTVDEVAEIIQSRVKIYVNENR